MNTESLRNEGIKIQLNPLAFGGLTEVDLGTSLPSRVPESMCPPSSATLLKLLGGKALGWTVEGSLMDRDEGST